MVDVVLRAVLDEMKNALREAVGGAFRLILFGSRARGDARPDSDVDLMVILPDERADLDTQEKVRDTVHEFSLHADYLFLVMVVSESLAKERAGFKVFGAVEREGVVI